jgi:hypothetical protein
VSPDLHALLVERGLPPKLPPGEHADLVQVRTYLLNQERINGELMLALVQALEQSKARIGELVAESTAQGAALKAALDKVAQLDADNESLRLRADDRYAASKGRGEL